MSHLKTLKLFIFYFLFISFKTVAQCGDTWPHCNDPAGCHIEILSEQPSPAHCGKGSIFFRGHDALCFLPVHFTAENEDGNIVSGDFNVNDLPTDHTYKDSPHFPLGIGRWTISLSLHTDIEGCQTAHPCYNQTAIIIIDSNETCDGLDNDCDGRIDENFTYRTYWSDSIDHDGFGDPDDSLVFCKAPIGYVSNKSDCDPENKTWPDKDGDGYGSKFGSVVPCGAASNADCNDGDRSVHPGAEDICDLLDNDCDGMINEDVYDFKKKPGYIDHDRDGFGKAHAGRVYCEIHPDTISFQDGDCDDSDPAKFPFNLEICDGKDNDCNGQIDDIRLILAADKSSFCSATGELFTLSVVRSDPLPDALDDPYSRMRNKPPVGATYKWYVSYANPPNSGNNRGNTMKKIALPDQGSTVTYGRGGTYYVTVTFPYSSNSDQSSGDQSLLEETGQSIECVFELQQRVVDNGDAIKQPVIMKTYHQGLASVGNEYKLKKDQIVKFAVFNSSDDYTYEWIRGENNVVEHGPEYLVTGHGESGNFSIKVKAIENNCFKISDAVNVVIAE